MIDETGNKYGRLTVIRPYSTSRKGIVWLCRCDCGRDVAVYGTLLRNGTTRSCGCYRHMTHEERRATGLKPYSYQARTASNNDADKLLKMLKDCRNELCLKCGNYKQAHNGACDGCRWYR